MCQGAHQPSGRDLHVSGVLSVLAGRPTTGNEGAATGTRRVVRLEKNRKNLGTRRALLAARRLKEKWARDVRLSLRRTRVVGPKYFLAEETRR